MLVGWGIRGLGDWRLGRSSIVVAMLLAFVTWVGVGYFFAQEPILVRNFLVSLLKIALPFLVGITLMEKKEHVRWLAWVIVATQGYLALDFNRSYYQGVNRIVLEAYGGFDNNCIAAAMVVGALLAFFLGLAETRWPLKVIAFAASALMVHTIMFSFSRGGILGLIAGGIAAFILIPKSFKTTALSILAVLLALRLAGPEVRQRFMTTFVDPEQRDRSARSRVEQWGACLRSIRENPFLGVGANHWPLRSQQMGLPRMHAHSLWLETAAEMGVPGLLLLGGFYGLTMYRLRRLIKECQNLDVWSQYMARGVIASLLGFSVAVSFISVVWLEIPYYTVLLGAALLRVHTQDWEYRFEPTTVDFRTHVNEYASI
jgi:O-antigen ligase